MPTIELHLEWRAKVLILSNLRHLPPIGQHNPCSGHLLLTPLLVVPGAHPRRLGPRPRRKVFIFDGDLQPGHARHQPHRVHRHLDAGQVLTKPCRVICVPKLGTAGLSKTVSTAYPRGHFLYKGCHNLASHRAALVALPARDARHCMRLCHAIGRFDTPPQPVLHRTQDGAHLDARADPLLRHRHDFGADRHKVAAHIS